MGGAYITTSNSIYKNKTYLILELSNVLLSAVLLVFNIIIPYTQFISILKGKVFPLQARCGPEGG